MKYVAYTANVLQASGVQRKALTALQLSHGAVCALTLSDYAEGLLSPVNGATGLPVGGGQLTSGPGGHGTAIKVTGSEYIELPDAPEYSVAATGQLTVECWVAASVQDFTNTEGSGDLYVHLLGKGEVDNHEWVWRQYDASSANRPQRTSTYVFNASGGLGSGSYVQRPVANDEWRHIAMVIDVVNKPTTHPMGSIAMYENGVQADKDSLEDYNITPTDTNAPVRIGTRDGSSFFEGAFANFAIYDRVLTDAEIAEHYAMLT